MDWRALAARLRGSAARGSVESEMQEEMRFHVDMAADRYVRQGMSPSAARRQAAIDFGARESVREAAREETRARFLENIGSDLRFAFRSLRKSPAFTVAAVFTMALGIGGNTAVFSVVSRVLGPLPLPRQGDIAYVGWKWQRGGAIPALDGYQFDFVRRNATTLPAVATFVTLDTEFGEEANGQPVRGLRASQDLFAVLGIPPRGRGFTADEDRHNGADVVIISDAFWRNRLASQPAIIGRSLRLGGTTRTVIGVMPRNYRFPAAPEYVDFIVPLGLEPNAGDEGHNYTTIARATPASTSSQREADMTALTRTFRLAHPDLASEGEGFQLFSHTEAFVGGDLQKTLWVFLGAVMVVLIIACANTANLLLVRSAGREQEIAVRTALGAGRGRILQQLLTEGLVLSFMSAVVGVIIGSIAMRTLIVCSPLSIPRASEIGFDGRVLAMVVLMTMATGVVFGLAAAVPARRVRLQDTFKAIRGGGGRRRGRELLVFAETTLAVVLLAGAGLLITSFAKLQSVDPGFDPTHVIAMRPGRLPADYATGDAYARFEADALARISAVPGVTAVAAASNFPLERGLNFPVDTPEHPELGMGAVELRSVTSGYIAALRLTMHGGRDFTTREVPDGERVAIVNDAFVRHFWPGESALGKVIQVGHLKDRWLDPSLNRPTRVIGIVGDMKEIGLDRAPRPTVLLSRTQGGGESNAAIIVRADHPEAVMPAIRTALTGVEPRLRPELERMTAIVGRSIAAPRFRMLILTVFAGCALLVAAIGIYGVVAAVVQHRTREIGVRMALGATRSSVAFGVLRQCMTLVGAGAAAGTLLALGLTRFLSGMLFGVAPNDARTFAAVVAVLGVVGMVAGYFPARRAAGLDPTRALRAE